MSIDVGPRKYEVEKAAIDAAFSREVRELFKVFYFAVCSGGEIEKRALANFKEKIDRLRRVHVRALSVFYERDGI